MNQQFDEVVENPKYMLIGECWDSYDAQAQKPFQGPAGSQLNRLLYGVGISREKECYVTNIINERTPKNDFGIYYEDKNRRIPNAHLAQSLSDLREKIQLVKPKVLVLLGNESLKGVMGGTYEGIENWRGSILSCGNIQVIPTIHPSSIIRGGGKSHWYLPATIHDLKRAKKVAEGMHKAHNPKITTILNVKQLENFFAECLGQLCAFDIETTIGGGERILSIAFSFDESHAVVVNLMEGAPTPMEMIGCINRWMTSGRIEWTGQNIYNFDIPVMKRNWGFEVKNWTIDTMVAHQVLHPELPHDLGTLASFYTTIPYWKDTSGTDLLHYNGLDAVGTLIVAKGEFQELQSRGLLDQYKTYQHRLLAPLKMMYEKGVRIDAEYKERLKKELKNEARIQQREIDDYYSQYTSTSNLQTRLSRVKALKAGNRKTIKLRNHKTGKFSRKRVESLIKNTEKAIKKKESVNVNSPKELGHFLYNVLKLPKKVKKGRITTNETALNQLYIKTNNEFLKKMITLRKTKNMYSKYGKIELDQNGMTRTTYKFVETGRLSSGKYAAK